MNPAALLSYSHRGNMLWGVRSKSGLKTYMYWVPCFYWLVGWKHLDVRQRERMAKCPQCRDAKHAWCVSLSWSPSAGLSCCLVQWGGGVGRTGLWSPAILFLCPKTACCPVTHASLSCRERDSKDNGSGGEANRNVNSLGEVRWNIATEASFIGCRGQDDALALHLLPLTHLPSAFPCLRHGKCWLGHWEAPRNGSRARMLCLGKRGWRSMRFCTTHQHKKEPKLLMAYPRQSSPYRAITDPERTACAWPKVQAKEDTCLFIRSIVDIWQIINSDDGVCELWLGWGVGADWL